MLRETKLTFYKDINANNEFIDENTIRYICDQRYGADDSKNKDKLEPLKV